MESHLEDKIRIVLALDNDERGIELRNELIRRLDPERCLLVEWPEGCKDANDVLMRHGKEQVRECIEAAHEIPLVGIQTAEDVEEELPQLVHKCKELTPAGSWTASYSLCDLNGHVNNSFYLDIACDALPLDALRKGPLRFASIKYHREIPMGAQVAVAYAPSADGWYVVGRRDEHIAFECYLEFVGETAENAE